jgi:hypothetical protein
LVHGESGAVIGVMRDSVHKADMVDLWLSLTWAALWSVNALETVRLGQPRLADIDAIAARHGMPRDLSGDDAFPHLRRGGVGGA